MYLTRHRLAAVAILVALLLASLLLARSLTRQPEARPHAATIAQPTAIAFLGQMEYLDVGRGIDNPLLYLSQLQADHFGGFILDDHYQGLEDDVQNGGVARMGANEATAISQVSSLVSQATAAHLSQTFLRLNVSIYCPPCVSVTGSSSTWDIFNQAQVAQFVQTFRNQASFASQTGMTGIWFDGEPYGQGVWDETQNPALTASTVPVSQVRAQYFMLGQQAAEAVMTVNPALRLIADPVISNNPGGTGSETYTYYPDFIAGVVDVLRATPGACPLTIAPENSFAMTSASSPTYARVYSNVMGSTATTTVNGVQQFYGIKEGLLYWGQQLGVDLWDWHLANDTVMLASEPFSYKARVNAAMWGTPTDMADLGSNATWLPTYQANLNTTYSVAAQNNAPFLWVYDNASGFSQPSYTCQFPVGTIFTSTQPCPGVVQAATLPAP